MQVIIENLAIAVIGAIVIIMVLLILGISIGYKENIEKTNIGFYARVIITPILLIVVTYLYIQGQLNLDTLFFAIFWWLIPVLLCTDWSKIKRKQKPEDEKECFS